MDIEFQFSSQTIDGPTARNIQAVRSHTINLAQLIEYLCPDSREKSLALTNLEQSLMWAVKSITHNPTHNPEELA